MAIPAITTALSRALALRLDPGSTYLGGGLQLTFSPIAQASNRVVLPAPAPAGAVATALGLGLGSSRFLARPEEAAFFNSPGLSIITGGGSIAGSADATATTIARNTNRADATATSIGLANLDVITRGGGGLQIGTPGDPLRATASAATRSLLPSGGLPQRTAGLYAVATVRGLEGAPPADVRAGGTLPTFFGQPNAAVLASATLEPDPGTTTTTALAVADARGIEGYRVMALPGTAPGSPAEISGIAAATLSLTGAPANGAPPTDLTATAIGIDHAVLQGPVNGAVGIDRSTILTGSGNDTVMGRIHSKQTSGLDADGDGLLESFVFLDASALIGGPGVRWHPPEPDQHRGGGRCGGRGRQRQQDRDRRRRRRHRSRPCPQLLPGGWLRRRRHRGAGPGDRRQPQGRLRQRHTEW